MIDKKKLYKECFVFWGERSQLRQAQEECAELILAISHFVRHLDRKGKEWNHDGSVDNLIEETADVLNMAEQVRYIVGPKAVDKVREEKLKKVKEKLERYKHAK